MQLSYKKDKLLAKPVLWWPKGWLVPRSGIVAAMQRGNAASLIETLPSGSDLGQIWRYSLGSNSFS